MFAVGISVDKFAAHAGKMTYEMCGTCITLICECLLKVFSKSVWTEWDPLNTPVYVHGCAKLEDTVVVGGGYTYSPTGNLAETSIIDISDGSNVVAAAFNTLRYDFTMINLHGSVKIYKIGVLSI